jgi:hypothetical protein
MGFDFSQVDRLAADLAAAPAVVAVKAMRVVSDTADAVQQDAQGFAPVLTGELRASIEASAHGLTAEVSADAGYAGSTCMRSSTSPQVVSTRAPSTVRRLRWTASNGSLASAATR